MKIFISYVWKESKNFIPVLEKLFKTTNHTLVSEKTDYKTEGYDDEGIRTIIRDNYMVDCDLVLVLLSKNAWKRKHLDWEISTALRKTETNKRKGILVVLMENYGSEIILQNNKTPNRLIRNIKNGYCEIISYNDLKTKPELVKNKINKAKINAKTITPINSDPLRRRNTE